MNHGEQGEELVVEAPCLGREIIKSQCWLCSVLVEQTLQCLNDLVM